MAFAPWMDDRCTRYDSRGEKYDDYGPISSCLYEPDSLFDYCQFLEDEWVYVLMAIARKKENEGITTNSEIVFREVVKDEDDVEKKLSRLRSQALRYSGDEPGPLLFRVYVTANPRDVVSAFYNYKRRLDEWSEAMYYGDDSVLSKMKRTDRHFISELQRPENRGRKLFLFDLDDVVRSEFLEFVEALPKDPIARSKTPNGYHVVTTPFNYTVHDFPVEYELKNDGLLMVETIDQKF